MKYKLYSDVALARDLPEEGLRKGDVVCLVDHHVAPDGAEGYSIEGFNTLGETIGVTAVEAEALEPLRSEDIELRGVRGQAGDLQRILSKVPDRAPLPGDEKN